MTDRPAGAEADTSAGKLHDALVDAVTAVNTRIGFLTAALQAFVATTAAEAAGLATQTDGHWTIEIWVGAAGPLSHPAVPEELISDAIDAEQLLIRGDFCAAPLLGRNHLGGTSSRVGPRSATAEASADEALELATVDAQFLSSALIFKRKTARINAARGAGLPDLTAIEQTARLLASMLRRIDIHDRQARRIRELKRILQAAANWQRLESDEALLHAIADTACELLRCERASIFLWDRRRNKLIGRPALGIKDGALEVDDHVGIVGEVLRTAEPKIWNSGSDDEHRINRAVDQATDFQTRSLVAVPMSMMAAHQPLGIGAGNVASDRGAASAPARPQMLGVFEAINQLDTGFQARDAVVLADLATHAAVAIDSLRTRRSLTAARDRLVEDAALATQLIGNHPSLQAVRETASKVAATDLTALILGQNGTGKEVLARFIHFESPRRSGPFVAVNCAALVESLLESELFGHEKGAFTDAQATRQGKFELASDGTLFLDEVGDMSAAGQAKLLRVLEEKVVVRVGGSVPIPVDVRVIAATNQPLEKLVAEKRFRQDLYFRLNVVSLMLPPLRERGEDILQLSEHFLADFCYQIGRPIPALSRTARQALLSHPWPGNVRELRNTIERVCYLTSGDTVSGDDLMLQESPAARVSGQSDAGNWPSARLLADATREFQVAHIERAIEACRGNMTEAANCLGLHRSNLYRKMRQLGMPTSNEAAD